MYHWVPLQTFHANMLLVLNEQCFGRAEVERLVKGIRMKLWGNVNACLHFFFFLTPFLFFSPTLAGPQLNNLTFNLTFYFSWSPWRLCGPQPGPPSQFCPVARSRRFSTRCLRSETCTKASILAWRPGWANTARLSPPQVRRGSWSTRALSWWWETCFWKW